MKIYLRTGEQLLRKGTANCYIDNKIYKASSGIVYLTNDRLIYHKFNMWKMFFLGIFIWLRNEGDQEVINIPLSEIKEVSRTSLIGRTVFLFKTSQVEFSISFSEAKENWINGIISAIQSSGLIVEGDPNRFTVHHSSRNNSF